MIAPDKLIQVISSIDGILKLDFFKNPLNIIKKIMADESEIPIEIFKIKAKELLKDKFEKWFNNLGTKIGFLVYKKEKYKIKFFKEFKDVLKLLENFSEKEKFQKKFKNI